MAQCDVCGQEEGMPYRCRFCGGTFCGEHRLPENHSCPGLENWGDPSGVFGQAEGREQPQGQSRIEAAKQQVTARGGPLGYFRGNMTFVFLGLMWVVFFIQFAISPLFGIQPSTIEWASIFTLNTQNPLAVWTWVISIFAHGGLTHLFFNSIVLYFFGPVVERRVGTKRFTALFIASGILAGLAQVWAAILMNPEIWGVPIGAPGTSAVLGASGAIMALMGVLTVLNPNLRIYLYFIIPMPLWVATLLFAIYSIFMSSIGGIGAGNVAQLAHLAGLVVGLAYGMKLKQEGARAPKQLQFGGGGRGGGGRGGGGRGPF